MATRLALVLRLDLRSIALFRVALAGYTLHDLLGRLCDARALYTDAGVLPRPDLLALGEPWATSLHLATGATSLVVLLLAAQMLLALYVLVGARPRLAALATFVLLGSLNSRNPLALLPGDALVVGLWLWAAFLPLGARWSLDAARSGFTPADDAHRSWAAPGLVGLLAAHVVLAALGQPLALAPLVIGLLALVPAAFWRGARRALDRGHRLRIYYDQDCGTCRATTERLLHFLVVPHAELAPAQDQQRIRALMESRRSWVVVDAADVAHTKWRGFVALVRHSLLLRWLAPVIGASAWDTAGDALHDFAARRRAALARLGALFPGPAAGALDRAPARVVPIALLVLLALWLGVHAGVVPGAQARPILAAMQVLSLESRAPQPRARPLVPVGQTPDKRDLNLLVPGASPFEPAPEALSRRWIAWQTRLEDAPYAAQRRRTSAYVCARWYAGGGEALESVRWIDLVPTAPGYEQHIAWRDACPRP